MRRNYTADFARIESTLACYEQKHGLLVGIVDPALRQAFIEQIVDSEQRVLYTERLQERGVDPLSAIPYSGAFDPLKAAIVRRDAGDFDEAVWLIYLFVHFGRHRRAGWRYVEDVYGKLGDGNSWDWVSISGDPTMFRFWLHENQERLRAAPGPHGFGNHRKYESLNAWEATGTGAAVESYVEWVDAGGGDHASLFASLKAGSPELTFDDMYVSLKSVRRFGRIARFDYLTMLMKLDLADIRPPHSYLIGATGPLAGARLLIEAEGEASTARQLQNKLAQISTETLITPDVLEDAVCNWQKSPSNYIRFSG